MKTLSTLQITKQSEKLAVPVNRKEEYNGGYVAKENL